MRESPPKETYKDTKYHTTTATAPEKLSQKSSSSQPNLFRHHEVLRFRAFPLGGRGCSHRSKNPNSFRFYVLMLISLIEA